jgi:hypothetical protein
MFNTVKEWVACDNLIKYLKSEYHLTISGEQGEDKEGGGLGRSQAISSPWDVTRVGPTAFAIAMAGSHQVCTGRGCGYAFLFI